MLRQCTVGTAHTPPALPAAADSYDDALEAYTEAIQACVSEVDREEFLHVLYSNRAVTNIQLKRFRDALVSGCEGGCIQAGASGRRLPRLP